MDHKALLGDAEWITPGVNATTCIRGEFTLDSEPTSAKLDIVGLGMFKVYINGEPVNDDLFGTLVTDFHKNPDEACVKLHGEQPSHRIYVNSYDITSLRMGRNAVCVELSTGWYNAGYTKYGTPTNYGFPKLCFRLRGECGRKPFEYLSDEKLFWHSSNITSLYFFEGEEQDYNSIDINGWLEPGYDCSDWERPKLCEIPDTEFFEAPDCPPDRVIRTIKPVLIGEYDGGYLYDAGENITGTPVLTNRYGKRGEKLVFKVSERLLDGKLEGRTSHGQTSTFITDSDPEREYMLRFMWNGFRYIWASENAVVERVDVIHSDVKVSSAFDSDNEVLNWLYTTYLRTQLDNMHCGIPSDCPHLEKRGYTGDGQLMAECGMLMLDSESFYRKWIYDIADCQDKISGHVQYTAPYIKSGGGPGGWGCAISELPYRYLKYYGDIDFANSFIPNIIAYLEYLESRSDPVTRLVSSDQKGEWCLGDWCTPTEVVIPPQFVNTYFFVRTIEQLIEICQVAGYADHIPGLRAYAQSKRDAIKNAFYNPENGDFCGNVQGANAFALDIGLGDERTVERLAARYENAPAGFDTGIFGTDLVIKMLLEHGYVDRAFELLTCTRSYSFGRWMNDGCTTFPEQWTYDRSMNHPMFGAVTRYLFTELLGIKQKGFGFEEIVIEPKIPSQLGRISGSVKLKTGVVKVSVSRNAGMLNFSIDTPVGGEFIFNGDTETLEPGHSEFNIRTF